MRLLSNKFVVIWLAGLLAASAVWALTFLPSGPLSQVNTLVFDTYQRIKPREWAGTDIVVVDIDEKSLKQLGQWPWPRDLVAKMIDRLGQLGAATIVFDVVFAEADRSSPMRALDQLREAGAKVELPADSTVLDNDKILASAIERNYVVTGFVLGGGGTEPPPPPKAGHGFSGTEPPGYMRQGITATRNLAILDRAAVGLGRFNFRPGQDGVVRSVILLEPANNSYYPILGMEALRVVQGAGGFKIKSSDGSGEADTGNLAIVGVQVGALEVPTDAAGALTIYHSPMANKPTLSAYALLEPERAGVNRQSLQEAVANHIVLIGTSAQGLLDLRSTPLEPVVPGVTIHAEMIDQIISGTYITRPDIALGTERFAAILGALLVLAVLPFFNPLGNAATALFLTALTIGGFWYAFSEQGLLFSPVLPVLTILAASAAGSVAYFLMTERQGKFVREAFGRYLAPALVEQLADNPQELTLGGEERELTLLFCDIRGFTSLSEGLGPVELTTLLNDFLTPMSDALLKEGATIDKYMGDAIMAFWNAPIHQDNHRQLACNGLLDMRAELEELNRRIERPIQIGIGLNTGPCCVGNLGSSMRFNYSAIGDAVNVASRIEGQTKQYGLDNLVSEETLEGVEGIVTLEVDRVGVVGREQPLTVHTLLAWEKDFDRDAHGAYFEAHQRMLDAYRAGDVELGLLSMHDAQDKAPEGLMRLYAIYAERLAVMRDEGVPDDWDGVYRATSK